MTFIRARGLDIYYELRGAGPRLLVISGSGGDLRRTAASQLPAQFATLAYDQRGLGQTTIPDGPYTMADYAEDADALLEALGWDRCLVMGTSFGGMVAQEFALRFPGRVGAAVRASLRTHSANCRSLRRRSACGRRSPSAIFA